MTTTFIGHARCSTGKQDLTAQQAALADLGVAPDRIYVDRGLTGTNRSAPDWIRHWPPFVPETCWLCRSSIGWLGRTIYTMLRKRQPFGEARFMNTLST